MILKIDVFILFLFFTQKYNCVLFFCCEVGKMSKRMISRKIKNRQETCEVLETGSLANVFIAYKNIDDGNQC